jgi:hypothetical protein
MEHLVNDYAMWLNTTVPDSAFLLGVLRFFFAATLAMTLWSGLRLCLRYPTVLAFWLASAPIPFALVYFAAQTYYSASSGPDATVALLWVNTSLGLAFAGYWTLLGMLRKLMSRIYG